jgi:hypothetical protein
MPVRAFSTIEPGSPKARTLNAFLTCKNDAEKATLSKIIHVVKRLRFENVDYRCIQQTYLQIIRDYFQTAFKMQT